jgi:hypothetical protein
MACPTYGIGIYARIDGKIGSNRLNSARALKVVGRLTLPASARGTVGMRNISAVFSARQPNRPKPRLGNYTVARLVHTLCELGVLNV